MSMTVEALRDAVAGGGIDTVVVAFTDPYGRLVGKRFDAGFFCDETIGDGTHACDYLLTVDMEMEPTPGYEFASWEQGYGDVHLVPDLTTLRRAAWTDGAAIVLCDVVTNESESGATDSPATTDASDASDASDVSADRHGLVDVAPRTILRRQIDRLADAGLIAMAASELEFFVYDDSYRDAHVKGYRDLRAAGWYIEDYHLLAGARVEPYVRAARQALTASGIAVESSKGEWGRGQQELNIRYVDVFEMADRHTVMKHAMKELADSMGLSVTFMAKPAADGAGSSGHIHLSLWDPDAGTNVFASGVGETATFRHFLAGWLAHAPDFMICYAPTINSYKRYVDASWAPTRLAWSRDNRTAGFRVVGSGPSLRIECRIPGADCNPYLAYAATLASGLAGLEQELEPPDAFRGDVYHAELPRVPISLEQAVPSFRDSAIARAAFGDAVVDHYVHMCEVEVAAYHAAVTDWERSRYFERI